MKAQLLIELVLELIAEPLLLELIAIPAPNTDEETIRHNRVERILRQARARRIPIAVNLILLPEREEGQLRAIPPLLRNGRCNIDARLICIVVEQIIPLHHGDKAAVKRAVFARTIDIDSQHLFLLIADLNLYLIKILALRTLEFQIDPSAHRRTPISRRRGAAQNLHPVNAIEFRAKQIIRRMERLHPIDGNIVL